MNPTCLKAIMNVPDRLNHRRRVVYAALRKTLARDQRIPKLFIFWERAFAKLEHFVLSPYLDQAANRGLLNEQEKRDLTRALMHFMSYSFEDLPPFPEEFVNFKPKPVTLVPTSDTAGLDTPVPLAPSSGVVSTYTLPALSSSVPSQLTPHDLVFREVLALELKLLQTTGHRPEAIQAFVIKATRPMDLPLVEPLLQIWSRDNYKLEALSPISDPLTMQSLIQIFYLAACEAAITPVLRPGNDSGNDQGTVTMTDKERATTPMPENTARVSNSKSEQTFKSTLPKKRPSLIEQIPPLEIPEIVR
ncbi:MAG: hypothetical protein ACRCYY_07710 [Trueperaceae bacterium]